MLIITIKNKFSKFKKLPFIAIICLAIFSFSFIKETQSSASDNVSGFAWSENIGWISFNNTSGGSATSYGVNLDQSTGVLSGYAWSENLGWISFNRSDTGNPPGQPYQEGNGYIAKVDLSTKEVSGWAKVLAIDGGWDGWIKLRCYNNECNRVNYGVYLDNSVSPAEFRGWAWSDMVLGWLSFNCAERGSCGTSNYKVVTGFTFNNPPSATNLSVSTGNYCTASYPPIYFSWVFSDPNAGDTQSAYQIQIDNNSDFSSPELDTGKIISSSNNYSPLNLSYKTPYYWRVKVWDSKDAVSNWTTGPQFTTEKHSYPSVNFTWQPENPRADQNTLFTDQSMVYGGATKKNWSWSFADGNPSTSNQQNPTIKFRSFGSKTVFLQITDSDNYSCSVNKDVPVQLILPFPLFREILPF